MKQSNYNIIVKLPNSSNSLVYNTLYGGLICLEPEYLNILKECKYDSNIIKYQKAFEELKNQKFIIEDDEDEFEFLKYEYYKAMFDNAELALTIAPTLACNFKCPYCHNRDLVFVPEDYSFLDVNEIMQFFEKRKGVLDGICISGGEPLMQEHLIDFLKEIKKFGYPIKLDTNGNMPDKLKEVCETGLVDYVAMDIKNSPDKYISTVGLNQEVFQLDNIKRSIAYLLTTDIDYEFRTTVVKELHEVEDILDIARWIRGAKRYYLQSYEESENVIQQGFSSYSYLEMQELIAQVKEIIPIAELRGVKEG